MQNWSPSTGVPGNHDTAIIGTTVGGFTVLLDQAAQVGYLTLINTTILGTNSLKTYGTFECQNSTLSPSGGVVINGALLVDPIDPNHNTMTVNCPLTINGSGMVNSNAIFKIGAAVSVVNAGTFTLADGGQLTVVGVSNATFINQHTFQVGSAVCSTGSGMFSNTCELQQASSSSRSQRR
jgi:hypothetical protein